MVFKSIRKHIGPKETGKVRGAHVEPGKVKMAGVKRLGSPCSPHPAIHDIRRATRIFLVIVLCLTSMLAVASHGLDKKWSDLDAGSTSELVRNRVEVGMAISILSEFDSSPYMVDHARPKKREKGSRKHA